MVDTRRKFLQTGGVAIGTAIIGCVGETNGSNNQEDDTLGSQSGTVLNSSTTQLNKTYTDSTNTTAGSDNMEPLSTYARIGNVSYGRSGGFELEADPKKPELGADLAIRLKNTEEEIRETGSRDKYIIQKQNQERWEDLYWADSSPIWIDKAIGHPPNSDGFEWNFKMSKEGLSREYAISTEIQSGEYRFVYWGMIEAESLGVKFEMV